MPTEVLEEYFYVLSKTRDGTGVSPYPPKSA